MNYERILEVTISDKSMKSRQCSIKQDFGNANDVENSKKGRVKSS